MASPIPIPMPQPGEVTTHQLGANLTMLDGFGGIDDPYVTYEAVDVRGGTRVHAAIVTHHPKRSVVSRWALCSVTRSRFRVSHRRCRLPR